MENYLQNMIVLIFLILNSLYGFSAIENVTCLKKNTFLETKGNAVISVFVDANYGPQCNDSSIKGHQQVSTALKVIETLNKNSFVPGMTIGVNFYDTCEDKMHVYKQILTIGANSECTLEYNMGILIADNYKTTLEPFKQYGLLPIINYKMENLTNPLIDILVHFLTTKYETIDLVLATSPYVLGRFLDVSKDNGLCVKSYLGFSEMGNSTTERVIVALGGKEEIQSWISQSDNERNGVRETWIVLPIDDSILDDVLPEGSFVINTEAFTSSQQGASSSSHLGGTTSKSLIHSPYLLSIGKAIIEVAHVLQRLREASCPPPPPSSTSSSSSHGNHCTLPRFDPNTREDLSNTETYDILQIPHKSQYLKYIIQQNINHEYFPIATYRINSESHKIQPQKILTKLTRLCTKQDSVNCQKCANFQERSAHGLVKIGIDGSILKSGVWIPIYLTIMVSGTFACIVIFLFILYRYFVDESLDGNPFLTLILILGTIFMLQTILPFCMDDEYMGAVHLNSRKIFISTLAFGLIFSIMLSRAFFLAFSVGGIFTVHINGYLQSLMVFFMFGVQVVISTMYFALGANDPSEVLRSPSFIGLLGYDIFLLACLLIVSCFITQIQRNYNEGKCFFATVIGILIVWTIWVTCFILMDASVRDIIVCFGIIATAYLIIIGILIPRTYYMVTHSSRDKNFGPRFDPTDLGPDPRMNTMARQALDFQSRHPFYEYVRPSVDGISNAGNFRIPMYPNCYGSVSPYLTQPIRNNRSPTEHQRTPGYNNYGFHPEMREVENAYVVPRVCIENTEFFNLGSQESIRAETKSRRELYKRQKAKYRSRRKRLH
ncbi:protein bride of sevenless isoform X2 [Leptopilina heterotoma]|uniref:protein bride of sevenless isoform X2 n=1 Tax=Leptopilina heterotoma TaxID=63436 RepID=UPI001CA9A563|nr:protein bride of sevenless isoform X2 [Leptopilina heterotoma]